MLVGISKIILLEFVAPAYNDSCKFGRPRPGNKKKREEKAMFIVCKTKKLADQPYSPVE